MYGSFRLNSNKSDKEAPVQKPVDPASSRPAVQQACQSCRLKKVRCSGERPACSRCNTFSKSCIYSSNPPGKTKAREGDVGEPSTRGTEPHATQLQSARTTHRGSTRQDSSVAGPDGARFEDGTHLHDTVQPKPDDASEPNAVPEGTEEVAYGGEIDDMEMLNWPTPDLIDNTLFPSDMNQFEQALRPDFDLPCTTASGSLCSTTTGSSVNDETTSPAETATSATNTTISATYGLQDFHFPDTASGAVSSQAHSTAGVDLSLLELWQAGPVPALASINIGPIHSCTGSDELISPTTAPDFALLTGCSSSGVEMLSPTAAGSRSPPGTPSSLPQGKQCKCLKHVALLIYELETSRPDMLDGQLASHKEAVDFGRALLQCQSCSQRPENLMQLLFLTDGLLKLSDVLVNTLVSLQIKCHQQQQQQQKLEATVRLGKRHRHHERPSICFGELEIDSTPEWEAMVANLIAMQLGAMRQLMTQVERCSENMNGNNVRLRASHARISTEHMIRTVQRVSSMPREAV